MIEIKTNIDKNNNWSRLFTLCVTRDICLKLSLNLSLIEFWSTIMWFNLIDKSHIHECMLFFTNKNKYLVKLKKNEKVLN